MTPGLGIGIGIGFVVLIFSILGGMPPPEWKNEANEAAEAAA